MACCAQEPKLYDNSLFERLRNVRDLKINMKLKSNKKDLNNQNKNIEFKFDEKKAKWKDNVKDIYDPSKYENEEENEKIQKIKEQIRELQDECEEKEKEYLAKTIRLLYMVQTHCQIKQENEMLFEKYGIKTGNVSLQDIPKANDDYLEPVKEEKKKEKELIQLDN